MVNVEELCRLARVGAYKLAGMSTSEKNTILCAIAHAIKANEKAILEANKLDLDSFDGDNSAFKDRLTLTKSRIDDMVDGIIEIADLPDPIGEVVESFTTDSGLSINKVRASLGVIGVIYEARPNVTVDVVGLCLKTGNAVVLRGGADAINSNRALYKTMIECLTAKGYPSEMIQFIDDKDRNATMELLKQGKYVDVVIPRGGNKLKELVLANATMPVIASAGGNCHIYVHESADMAIAERVIINAKTQRPTVCNAAEQLLIDRTIAKTAVPKLFKALQNSGVTIKADAECCALYNGIEQTCDADYYEEHLGMLITVKLVDGVNEAIAWINEHSTSHSEAIIATDTLAQRLFASQVDSGCVYVNASTRFTDGFEFGFGAEIGISTQKLHARGPLGLKQLTSEKYVIVGDGAIRK